MDQQITIEKRINEQVPIKYRSSTHQVPTKMKTDFQQLIKSNFKNTVNFGRVIGVSYPTAWRYVNYPLYMRLIDIQKLSDELKIDIKIIVQMAINSSVITVKNEGDE